MVESRRGCGRWLCRLYTLWCSSLSGAASHWVFRERTVPEESCTTARVACATVVAAASGSARRGMRHGFQDEMQWEYQIFDSGLIRMQEGNDVSYRTTANLPASGTARQVTRFNKTSTHNIYHLFAVDKNEPPQWYQMSQKIETPTTGRKISINKRRLEKEN